jgi:endonuclease YncB( thermonuclease family)
LIKKMDVVKFQKQALKELKKRKSWKYDIYNKKQIPRELNYIFYTLNGSNFELEKINKYLYSKIYI